MTMGRARSFLKEQRGAAAAEMALIAPLAVVLMFVTFDGAYYMLCEQRVVKGVRNAARYAARLDLSEFSCPAGTFSGSTETIQNLARTGALSAGTATIPGWQNSDVQVAVTCSSGRGGIYEANGGNAPRVRVSARVIFPSMLGEMGFSDAQTYIAAAAESPVTGL